MECKVEIWYLGYLRHGEINSGVGISNFTNLDPPVMSHGPLRPKKYLKTGKTLIISQRNGIKSRNFAFRLIWV